MMRNLQFDKTVASIKNGYYFREHILKELLSSDYSFLFIFNNYKESDSCLNENNCQKKNLIS
jgi:hypothetical protein